jgi:hypothetical protein
LKTEPTQSSETSAFNTQTPGKYPEDNISLQQHGESLKTKIQGKIRTTKQQLPTISITALKMSKLPPDDII